MPGNLVGSQDMLGTSRKRVASFGSALSLMSPCTTLRAGLADGDLADCWAMGVLLLRSRRRGGASRQGECLPKAATASLYGFRPAARRKMQRPHPLPAQPE